MSLRLRVALAISAAWLIAGTLWGVQTALGSTLVGSAPVALGDAIMKALVQTVPWIPVTLAIIAITQRLPLTWSTWRRNAMWHVSAAIVLAFIANVLVVLAYQVTMGSIGPIRGMITEGARWMAVRLHVSLMIYAAIAAMTQIAMNYRGARARELQMANLETQLTRARLEALNAQIRPHFLFNTMHAIGQLWRSGRHDEADRILDSLGTLFHHVNDATSQMEVPLRDELDLVREYLAIESARFRDRLTPIIEVAPDVMAAKVPPLILQPIVENAVRHGIGATSTASVIEVHATRENGQLRLTVRDDGPGPHRKSETQGTGTGLRNTSERLTQLYGAGGRIAIHDAVGGGTLVVVEIPYSETGVLHAG